MKHYTAGILRCSVNTCNSVTQTSSSARLGSKQIHHISFNRNFLKYFDISQRYSLIKEIYLWIDKILLKHMRNFTFKNSYEKKKIFLNS
jgi:hypothetical protein